MLYVVFFTDNPDHADARERLMPAHLGFLEQIEIIFALPGHSARSPTVVELGDYGL